MRLGDSELQEILLTGGFITKVAMATAEFVAQKKGVSVIDHMVEEGFITPDDLGKAVAKHYHVPYFNLHTHKSDKALSSLLSAQFIKTYRVVVCSLKANSVTVTTDNPRKSKLKEKLKQKFPGKQVYLMYSLPEDVDAVLEATLKTFKQQKPNKPEVTKKIEVKAELSTTPLTNTVKTLPLQSEESFRPKKHIDQATILQEDNLLYSTLELQRFLIGKYAESSRLSAKKMFMTWMAGVLMTLAVVIPFGSKIGGTSSSIETQQTVKIVTPTPVSQVAGTTSTNPTVSPTVEEKVPVPTIHITHTLTNKQLSTKNLNVRASASPQAKIVGGAKSGSAYTYTETQNGWYLITLENGTSGWVSGEYVNVD